MKAKTINSIITKKIKEWWASIEDESLRKRLEEGTIVTGGCIASFLLKEKVSDYDIYLRDKSLAADLARYYVGKFQIKTKEGIECAIFVKEDEDRVQVVVKSAGVASESGTEKPYEYFEGRPDSEGGEYLAEVMQDPGEIQDTFEQEEAAALEGDRSKDEKYRPIFVSTNAITLSSKIQIVLRFFGDPEEIHKNYDFVHCTNYWKSWDGGQLVLKKEALESLITKELRYVGSKYPVCSVFRIRKFVGRGWTINAGQVLKIVMQISDLNLHDINVLRDQLTGVDVAYFAQLLDRLKNKETVDTTYLVELIDQMF